MHKKYEPVLLLNTTICKANIKNTTERIKQWGGVYRPHFKTHQSAVIGEWFRQEGVECITVSSFKMAEYFVAHGWKDITVAITATALHTEVIDELASKVNLNILVEDETTIRLLEMNIKNPVGVFIKIDAGYYRTGINADDLPQIKGLLNLLKSAKNLIFIGFLAHAGNTYAARGENEIKKVVKPSLDKMLALKAFLKDNFPLMQLSWGDTPSCSVYTDFYGVDEFRPGNLVFYDYMQTVIGSCELKDIAVCMAAPVIAVHPQRMEIVVHAGAVHLSKDRVELTNGVTSFGKAIALQGMIWDPTKDIGEVQSLSQEHGVIKTNKEWINSIKPGDLIGILPVHSCLTANLMKEFLTTDGNLIEAMK
jgi:D-serine deaminase-like pyridoxal phosphate-dependent protein